MKFKFLNINDYYIDEYYEDAIEWWEKVDNPIGDYKELKDGEYLIRGFKKEERFKYYRLKGEWFLVEHITKDNGHYNCDATTYLLFPNLSEKEWDKIDSIPYKCLTKYWKRALRGYKFWIELRDIGRNEFKANLKYRYEIDREKV